MEVSADKVLDHKRNAILLVSFASEQCSGSLISTMRNMKYDMKTMIGDDWLARQPPEPCNTIVLLEYPNNMHACCVDVLSHSNNLRLLAMANPGANDRKSRIVGHFQDFFTWPCSDFEIRYRIERLFKSEESAVERESTALSLRLSDLGMIGQSDALIEAMSDLFEFASCDAPVLLKGETGTGKELAARAVHENSSRARRPFVSLNCGAIPDNLIENELFGHEKGAFTDAKETQQGLVAQAHSGTLFLDEVDTLSPVAQVSLLRFLETKEYRPLGGKELKLSDARIIAATNADLEKYVELGKFRRDLFFRLDVCGITLPPLCERGSDIDLLAQHFLQSYATKYKRPQKTLHPGMIEWMCDFKWSGNIRELDNLMHRLFLSTKTDQIFVPKPTPGQSASTCNLVGGIPWRKISYKEAKADAMEAFERSYLTWLMAESRGNLSLAARKTSQQRSSLRRLLQKHGIDKNAWKEV